MSDQPEPLDLRSHDIAADKRAELLELFPEVRTEGGQIDFDRLRLALGEMVDVGKERYGLTWPGKAECFKAIQTPSLGTLLPCRDESVDFDTTENLIIEGDNLEVLKLLQKAYLGQVKLIYIDPPYNTGNDFIYQDNYSESLRTYFEYTGQVDEEGRRFATNTEADGRFHSKWLNMMYPRLHLARNLLRDDGVIFVSIDDNECRNLAHVMSEVFGEENFQADIIWQKRYTRSNNTVDFTTVVEHILVYSRGDGFSVNLLDRTEEADARYSNPDGDPRGPWKGASFLNPATPQQRPNLSYPITNPNTGLVTLPTSHAWRRSRDEFQRLQSERMLYWGVDGTQAVPSIKMFLSDARNITPINLWDHTYAGNTDDGTKELRDLLGEKVFDNPKPTKLLRRVLEHGADKDAIVLDFFAGSGTTAQAVIEQNVEDGGSRKYILVQLPESTGRDEYPTIADVTKERVRRVVTKLQRGGSDAAPSLFDDEKPDHDLGFRVLKLAESNFRTWDANGSQNATDLTQQLELHIDHIREGRTDEDLLAEILLKSGFPLSTKWETVDLADNKVFSIAGGAMLVCLERDLTLEGIRAMAALKPERVVCLDDGFAGNDQLKANAVKIFEANEVVKFQTV